MAELYSLYSLDAQYGAWLLARISKKLGFFGLLGLAIMLGCGLFFAITIQPLKNQIILTQEQLEQLEQTRPQAIIAANKQEPVINDVALDVAAFKQLLPQANTLQHWLGLINKAAFKHGLKLNKGDYKFTQVKQGQIARNQQTSSYEIVLPVTGQYAQIRQFIAHALQLQPSLALSSIKIQRDNTLSPNVEARLVFVLFLQGDSL
jgi:Tfp pilus assembly protein PilO